MATAKTCNVYLKEPHERQREFLRSEAKRRVIRAGRRGGKTVGMSIYAVEKFLEARRVLYAAPTQDQVGTFWHEVTEALRDPIEAGVFEKNETNKTIELPHTKQRIRAKTAWNADTLRGDYADVLILDEFQMMSEDTWDTVGAPMLLDNDGDAIFIYTPPSLRKRARTKARNPRHAAELFRRAKEGRERWAAFHFTSLDNPHISEAALQDITQDMTALAYQQEILAEDKEEAPGALWKRESIEAARVSHVPDAATLSRVCVGVDPSATSGGDECGIIAAAYSAESDSFYVMGDYSKQCAPVEWARVAVSAYHEHAANVIVYESNQGGEMVAQTLRLHDDVPLFPVWASRGKQTRAEPISLLYEQGKVHHVGALYKLEDEMCLWEPGGASPNRLDALVWALTYLKDNRIAKARIFEGR
jgi:phage terminase large subunit-like protein